jgi:hypothetical protein
MQSTVLRKRQVTDNRRETRMLVVRPVALGLRTGITQNISTSGVFFETDADYDLGNVIDFTIEVDSRAAKKLILRCRGKIVRVERRDGKVGVAVTVLKSQARVSIQDEPTLLIFTEH